MLDWFLKRFAAKWWQRRCRTFHPSTYAHNNNFDKEWEEIFPNQCLYCSYTRWANGEKGQNLKIGKHECKEGNSPPEPLPNARVVKK